MAAARQAAKRGACDVPVVYGLDCLARDFDDLFLLRREFTATGVTIRTA
jgi:hypothetical protein